MNTLSVNQYFTIQLKCNTNTEEGMCKFLIGKFRSKGIFFDYGYSFTDSGNFCELEIDWSLEGGTSNDVLKILEKYGVYYRIINLREASQ